MQLPSVWSSFLLSLISDDDSGWSCFVKTVEEPQDDMEQHFTDALDCCNPGWSLCLSTARLRRYGEGSPLRMSPSRAQKSWRILKFSLLSGGHLMEHPWTLNQILIEVHSMVFSPA